MEIKKNIGTTDRYIRVMLGLGFLMNIIQTNPGRLGTFIHLALGLILLVTAYTQYCAPYDLFKIDTLEEVRKPAEPKEGSPAH